VLQLLRLEGWVNILNELEAHDYFGKYIVRENNKKTCYVNWE